MRGGKINNEKESETVQREKKMEDFSSRVEWEAE